MTDNDVPFYSKKFAAGGPYNLVTDADGPRHAARKVVMLAAGDLTFTDAQDVVHAWTGLYQGFEHVAHVKSITPSVAVAVYW